MDSAELLKQVQRALRNQVAAALCGYMQDRGITVEVLASGLGLYELTIQLILDGRNNVPLNTLAEILLVLGARLHFSVVPINIHEEVVRIVQQHDGSAHHEVVVEAVMALAAAGREVVATVIAELVAKGVLKYVCESTELQIVDWGRKPYCNK